MRQKAWLLIALLLIGLWTWQRLPSSHGPGDATLPPPTAQAPAPTAHPGDIGNGPAFLPEEARDTLAAITHGGPFAHRQDGAVFQNRERRLPQQARGYYHEYTVETPGSPDRGPRRIISGGTPPVEFFYTDDHYRSFRRFEASAGGSR